MKKMDMSGPRHRHHRLAEEYMHVVQARYRGEGKVMKLSTVQGSYD